MMFRSLWAAGSLIYSSILPHIASKLRLHALQQKCNVGLSRVMIYQACRQPDGQRNSMCSYPTSNSSSKTSTSNTAPRLNASGLGRVSVHERLRANLPQQTGIRCYSSDYEDNERRPRMRLKLMDIPELTFPNPLKSLKNRFFALLIRSYFDNTFTMDSFIEGCIQAISMVSSCISKGNFDNLQGLVEEEAIQEVQNSYADLNNSQRRFLQVQPEDVFFRFVYEIGMMFDDETNQRFVEITVVLQGFHGFHDARQREPADYYSEMQDNKDNFFICNYRFIREFTKGIEGNWIINKLNHFNPKELSVKY